MPQSDEPRALPPEGKGAPRSIAQRPPDACGRPPLVEKSSKPAAPINYHWRFQLPRASKKNQVGPVWEPPVETYFHWRLS
jgi:hypothetical protein